MPHIEITGRVRLYYESWGSGPPVVFVHALSMSHRFWDNQVLAMTDRYRAIVYDQRGHGLSEKPDSPYVIQTYADDLGAVLAGLGLENTTVVGWSIGSWTALDYAHRNGERVSRLVLVGVSPRLLPAPDWTHAIPRENFERFLGRLTEDRAAATYDFYKGLLAPGASNHLLEWIVRTSLEMPLRAFLQSAEDVVYGDKRAILSEIEIPTLILNGKHDAACPSGAGQYLAATMPHARLVTFEHSGHFPNLEEPRAFNNELLRFLEEGH
jgi:pimeloyl-ACP methyl ester carboxylesterase